MAQISIMARLPEDSDVCRVHLHSCIPSSAPPSESTSLQPLQPVDLAACAASSSSSPSRPRPTCCRPRDLCCVRFEVRTGFGLPLPLVRLLDYRNHYLLSLSELHSLVRLVGLLAPMRLEGTVLACDESLPEGKPLRFSSVFMVCFRTSFIKTFTIMTK